MGSGQRRDLTEIQRGAIRLLMLGRLYEMEIGDAYKRRGETISEVKASGYEKDTEKKPKTRDRLADEFGVSTATVQDAAALAKAVDNGVPELKEEVMNGGLKKGEARPRRRNMR